MTAREAMELLWLAMWTGSVAMLTVILLRGPLRRRFGASIAYAAWALVPVTWLALLLPARVVTAAAVPAFVALPVTPPVAITAGEAPVEWAGSALLAWAAGALVMAAWMAWQQRRFVRGLGALQVLDADAGVLRAQATAGLPALVGLLRPRIVMPADVEARYGAGERALMLAHERVHLRRGDAWVNALVALVRCLQWCNPLVHVAANRLRHDQELACDERVVADHPQSRRAYADAMLKTLVATQPVPLGCHWGITHPMKERLMMLRQDRPARRTRLAGAVLVGVVALGAGFAAWSAQPARVLQSNTEASVMSEGEGILGDFTLVLDELPALAFQVETGPGKPFSLRSNGEGGLVTIGGTIDAVTHKGQQAYKAGLTIRRDGAVIGTPSLVLLAGKPARVQIGEKIQAGGFKGIDLSMTLRADTREHAIPAPPPRPPAPNDDVQATVDPESRLGSSVRYPADALKRGESGSVVLDVDVDAKGRATDARVVSATAPGVFDQAALEAARQWQYNPRIEGGKAVPGTVRVPISFEAMPPAPPAPPVPPAASSDASIPPPPPAPPLPPDGNALKDVDGLVRAGGMLLEDAQAKKAGLPDGYRWVDVTSLVGKGVRPVRIESDILHTRKDGAPPVYAGYRR